MRKKQSVAFPNQVPSFNPKGKEDLEWPTVARKPRYSEQMESGVLFFVDPGDIHGKNIVFKVGISQSAQQRPGDPQTRLKSS